MTTLSSNAFDLPPLTLPLAEATYLLGYLKGRPFERRETLFCAYRIADYAWEQVAASTSGPLALEDVPEPLKHLEQELEKISPPPDAPVLPLAAIDWKGILFVIINELLKKFLGG